MLKIITYKLEKKYYHKVHNTYISEIKHGTYNQANNHQQQYDEDTVVKIKQAILTLATTKQLNPFVGDRYLYSKTCTELDTLLEFHKNDELTVLTHTIVYHFYLMYSYEIHIPEHIVPAAFSLAAKKICPEVALCIALKICQNNPQHLLTLQELESIIIETIDITSPIFYSPYKLLEQIASKLEIPNHMKIRATTGILEIAKLPLYNRTLTPKQLAHLAVDRVVNNEIRSNTTILLFLAKVAPQFGENEILKDSIKTLCNNFNRPPPQIKFLEESLTKYIDNHNESNPEQKQVANVTQNIHIEIPENKPIFCNNCNRYLTYKETTLEEHTAICLKSYKFKSTCGKLFASKRGAKHHENSNHHKLGYCESDKEQKILKTIFNS